MSAPTDAACALCGALVGPDAVPRSRNGEPCWLHPACWQRIDADNATRLDETRASLMRSFAECAEQTELDTRIGGLPQFPFARFDNAEFRKRSSKRIVGALERSNLDMSLLISAPTGRGKTSAIVARLHKALADACANAKPARPGYFATFRPAFLFLTGFELAVTRRNWPLGSEPPALRKAKEVELLILDELGFEPMTELPFEVIDDRYRGQRITFVTTGLRPVEFRARYGDAAYRRLTESGALIEDW